MHDPPTDVDVVVIGAGAAGLAATQSQLAAGCKVATLEARNRIGDRVWTELGHTPFDHGASFIHAEPVNPWTRIARRLRVPTMIDPRPRRLFVGSRPASEAELAAFGTARARAKDQVMAVGPTGAVSIAQAVEDAGPWSAHAGVALGPWLLGAENEATDTADFAAGVEGRDRLVASGYGHLVCLYGRGLPVPLDAAVKRIDYRGQGVIVGSSRGRLRGRLAIVTLPVGVLAAEPFGFEPPLPPDHLRALDALPMGLLAKVGLHFDGDPFGQGDTFYLNHRSADQRAALCQMRPCGQDQVVALVGGNLARAGGGGRGGGSVRPRPADRDLRPAPEGEAARRPSDPLGYDPFALGSYAVARPGGTAMREVLARPLAYRLLVAGEACANDGRAATVVGTHRSGKRAAREVLALLRQHDVTKAFAIAPKTSPSRAGDGGARHAQ